jgi:serine phosphatase RsbU (regulator of sigma subunit)/PAS domain-containing protein
VAAVVAVLAVLALALSDTALVIPLLVVGPLALGYAAARARQRYGAALANERAARVRSDFAARAGRLLEAPPEPQAMLEQIVRLAVPDMAELCSVDLIRDGELAETAAHAVDPRSAEMLAVSRARYPLDIGGAHPVAIVARTGLPHLQREIGPDRLRAFAVNEEHLQLMMRPGYATSLAVPLVARGRTIGVLSWLRFGASEPYTSADVELASEVARRAALALDNARLFAELRRTEGQLEAVLGNLAAAVTVQAPDGSLVYVNQAAAEMLGCASPDEVLCTPLARLLEQFVVLDERGRPYDLGDLPGRHALAGREAKPALTHTIDKATGDERWSVTKATAVRDAQGNIALAVNIIEDVTDARLVERRERFLGTASMLVSSSLDVDVTLDKVARVAVPELADWCFVEMPDERGVPRRAAAAGEVPEVPASDARLITVPMVAGDRVIGHITMGTSSSARRLREAEVALAEELGRRAGIAVENARVHAARTHIATTLQRSLLPPRLPLVPGVTIAARFRAAGETSEVGGDFYDVFAVGDAWMVVVGDVTGKGPEAAAITSLARFTMRTAAMYERSPGAVLARLNEALAADPDRRQLCTAVCARIETSDDGTLAAIVARGGHPAPYLVGARGGPQAVGTPGPLLGAFDHGAWDERRVTVGAGDALVFYTDGVTDTHGPGGELFGHERLEELLSSAAGFDADEVASRIDDALRAFEAGHQRDDVALLVLRCAPRPSARRESPGHAEPSIRR